MSIIEPCRPRVSAETVAICLTILLQVAAMIWWAGGVNDRLGHLERITAPLADGSLISTLSRIDERTSSMQRRMDRLTVDVGSSNLPQNPRC
jgi:Flp pilus assembly protein TadB